MKARRSSRTLAGVAVLALTSMLAACGGGSDKGALVEGDWNDIVAAAEEEGEVIFYNGSTEPQGDRLVAAFNEKYPDIEVKAERGGAEMIARIDAQISSGTTGADVFIVGDGTWWERRADDVLPVDGPGAAEVPAERWMVDGAVASVSGAPYSVFVWNTEAFPEGFESYDDFLAPEAKGKIGFRGDASVTAAGFLDFARAELGDDWLTKLGQQNLKKYVSVVPATEAVAAGEVGATPTAQIPHVLGLIESGAPIEYAVPSPGYAFDYGMGALKNASNPNAAVVFTDFASSPEGQAALNGDGYGIATMPGTDGAIPSEGWTMLDSSRFPEDVIEEWNLFIEETL